MENTRKRTYGNGTTVALERRERGPMPWRIFNGTDMRSAYREIPGKVCETSGYIIPNVYGRAIQLYLNLEQAARESDYRAESVVMWRALLTMLALRNLLDLPLVWEYVRVEPYSLFGAALGKPPRNADALLYPNRDEYQWDGHSFYVLRWTPEGQDPIDLAFYSPMTFICPVADWRKVFSGIPLLRKFFRTGHFREHWDAIHGGELDFVYSWLRDMKEHLEAGEGDSSARRTIIRHLTQYMEELRQRDESLTVRNLPLKQKKFGYTALLANLVPQLVTAYDIGGPVFSDQLCVLRVEKSEGNPFAPCDYRDNYRIKGGPLEQDVDLYAFLPIHPSRRAQCRENGLAESMTMRHHSEYEGREVKSYIHVSAALSDLPGIRLEKDYLLVEEGETTERNAAVYYKDFYGKNCILTKDTWPLFAVWPAALEAHWKHYYIMRSNERDDLRINGEPNTPSFQVEGEEVEMGDNRTVVQTNYVPDAIPIIRILRGYEGNLMDQGMSAGMVTPRRGFSSPGVGSAVVSVVFDSFSTRVFYRLEGNSQPVHEIMAAQDAPLEVTRYENSKDRVLELSVFFIAPVNSEYGNDTLFSIFRRSEDRNRPVVRPLLDGTIFQPTGMVMPDDGRYLVSDLRWNSSFTRPYFIAFMQQLCLHVMAWLYREHQITSIEWRYALPKATSKAEITLVNSIWNDSILGYLRDVSGDTITHTVTKPVQPGTSASDLHLITESAAASRFFAAYRGKEVFPKTGFIAVDIGRSRMDASLWQENEDAITVLKWNASVRVAGRQMFTRWIEDNVNNLTGGINDSDIQFLLEAINAELFRRRPDTAAKEAMLNRLLTTHSKEILANYFMNISAHTDDWGAALCFKITQSVALLMFSLGYQIGALIRAGRFQVPPGPGFFTIAFGGRDSNMLDWLTCANPVLVDFFRAGAAAVAANLSNVAITIITSDDPTSEVGRGLLVLVPEGSPTGWEDVGNREIMEDPYYFADEYGEDGNQKIIKTGAATAFYEAYRQAFPNCSDMMDLSDSYSQNALASAASRAVAGERYVDNVFKVLIESIYTALET